jgi:hypothetical protein
MLLRNLIKLLAFSAILLMFWFLHQGAEPSNSLAKVTASGQPDRPPAIHTRPQVKDDIYRGMTVQISYTANGVDTYLRMIDELADLGANTVILSTAAYQEHAGSGRLFQDLPRSPTKEQWAQLIERARSHGMKVGIMPVVLLDSPRGSEWRGVIQPTNWDEWFASYLAYVKFCAQVGLENNVEILFVGAELISTESFRDHWLKIIEEVRSIFHGKLVYSANWDHYEKVTFWDKLDLIGMTTYHKLADEENPPLETLLANWRQIKKNILDWQKTIGKPILFTEVGWYSQPGASIESWNYWRHDFSSEAGLEEQAKCYEAFIQTWEAEPAIAGAIWWEWKPGPVGPKDYGYSPKGKPAEAILRQWFKAGQKGSPQLEVGRSD